MKQSGEWMDEDEKEDDEDSEILSHGSAYADEDLIDQNDGIADCVRSVDRERDPNAWKNALKSRRQKAIVEEASINSVNEIPSGETGNTELLLAPPPEYSGNINMKNYFGLKARSGFFSLYQKLARQYQMDQVIKWSDDEDDDGSDDAGPGNTRRREEQRPVSPRHKFLSLLIAEGKHPPIPIIIRHDEGEDQLNLAHRSLGDDYIIYLSAVIAELPNLKRINLRGNRLTDRGLGKFIDMLSKQSNIVEVDLSDNKLDSRSSEALSSFLKTSHCTLKTLRLSSADLDDGETALFMEALEFNKSITCIDLSHNMLGGIGEKSVVRRSASSGGAAIAKALRENSTLEKLDLSWNKLGMSSALCIGDALRDNNTLLELNLAYNGIKNEGAEAIGAALLLNICLIRLDLSYNGIGANGSIELSVGLRMDEHVQLINMSGNPIGDAGGRALLQSLNYHAGAREILISDCSFEEVQSHQAEDINLTYPSGQYSLDMSKTRSRCIVYELLRQAAVRRGCCFKNLEHKYFPSQTTGIHATGTRVMRTVLIQLGRRKNPAEEMGEPYGPWRCPYKRPRHRYTKMAAVPWMEQLDKLMLVDTSTGLVYHPPDQGWLTFEFISLPRCPCPIQLLNGSGQQRLINMIKNHAKERSSILRMCGSLYLETYQLDEILESLEPKFRKEAFQALMPCVRDTSNTWELIQKYAPSLDDRKNIQVALKDMYYMCINAFSGHYVLDLSTQLGRDTGMRLAEISYHENSWCRRSNRQWRMTGHGHTAQKQNKNNFRNELYGRVRLEHGLSDDFFKKGLLDKAMGDLEFDFVSITRPMEKFEEPTLDYSDLKYSLEEMGFFTFQDRDQLALQKLAPDFLRDCVTTFKVTSNLLKKRDNVPVMKSTDSKNSLLDKLHAHSRSLDRMNSINEDKDSDDEDDTKVASPSHVALSRKFTEKSKRLGRLKRGDTSSNGGSSSNLLAGKGKSGRDLVQQRGASMSLFSLSQPVIPEYKKRLSEVHMFGNLVMDAECLLSPDVGITTDEIKEFATRKSSANTGTYIERVLTHEDLTAIQADIENELSLFSCDGRSGIDRYQLNMSIRILNDSRDFILEPIAMLRKTEEKKYELLGYELTDRSRASNNILEILGLTKDNSYYDIGLFAHPASKLLPTHRRFPIYDDVMLVGSEIHVILKLSDWRADIIAIKCREAVSRLFACFGVTEKCVRIVSHNSVEQKGSSEFPQCRFKSDCVNNTHLVMHHLDVMVEGVAFTERALVKASIEMPRIAGAKPESIGCVWRWRHRTGMDRGSNKVEQMKSTFDTIGNKFFILRSMLSHLWISCDQAKNLIIEFPQFGPDGQPYRETALLILFSRIIDLENYHSLVADVLPLDSHTSLFNRVGWLNALNGFQMDHFFELDLSLPDNRIVASSLAKLAAVEPGLNCLEPHFRRSVNDNYSRGWDIPANWIVESPNGLFESVPHKGRFNIIYTSSPKNGCRVVPAIRTAVQERYFLLGVPRGDGSDIYLTGDADPSEWDDVY